MLYGSTNKDQYCKSCGHRRITGLLSANLQNIAMLRGIPKKNSMHDCGECDSFMCQDLQTHKEKGDKYAEGVEYLEKRHAQ